MAFHAGCGARSPFPYRHYKHSDDLELAEAALGAHPWRVRDKAKAKAFVVTQSASRLMPPRDSVLLVNALAVNGALLLYR